MSEHQHFPARSATEAAVAALRAGRGVVVVDDADRENEGDVVLAAATVTAAQVAFLMTHCRGLVCLTTSGEVLDRLDLPPMVLHNTESYRTAFTVSVDAREGVTTGISAADRARTARLLADPTTEPTDLVRPGHLFPLRAHPQGLRGRRGHSEAASTLTRLAGHGPSAVICEVAAADGTMVRGDDLRVFAAEHSMPVLTIAQLAEAIASPEPTSDSSSTEG